MSSHRLTRPSSLEFGVRRFQLLLLSTDLHPNGPLSPPRGIEPGPGSPPSNAAKCTLGAKLGQPHLASVYEFQ